MLQRWITTLRFEDDMANGPFNQYATAGRAIEQAQYDEGLRQHMLRVYNYMMTGLGITGVVAFLTAMAAQPGTPLFEILYLSPLKWVIMLAPLGFVFFLSARVNTMSMGTAQTVFWAFAAVMGLSLSSIFLVFTGASIARVFFIAAGMFGAASLFGYTTTADLTRFGSFLLMGLIGIVLAGLVNLFIGSNQIG